MRLVVILALGLWTALAASGPARADSRIVVPITIGDAYTPYVDDEWPDGGLAMEIVASAFERTPYRIETVFKPWKRGLEAVRRGEVFASFPWAWTIERERTYLLSKPLFRNTDYYFTRAGWPGTIDELADLTGLRGCRPNGYGLFHLADWARDGRLLLTRPADMDACFQMLVRERVDFVMTDELEGLTLAARLHGGLRSVRVEPKVAQTVPMHLLASPTYPGSAEILTALDTAVQDMRQTGALDEIRSRHRMLFLRNLTGGATIDGFTVETE